MGEGRRLHVNVDDLHYIPTVIQEGLEHVRYLKRGQTQFYLKVHLITGLNTFYCNSYFITIYCILNIYILVLLELLLKFFKQLPKISIVYYH